eukprot:Pgem_evm1s8854
MQFTTIFLIATALLTANAAPLEKDLEKTKEQARVGLGVAGSLIEVSKTIALPLVSENVTKALQPALDVTSDLITQTRKTIKIAGTDKTQCTPALGQGCPEGYSKCAGICRSDDVFSDKSCQGDTVKKAFKGTQQMLGVFKGLMSKFMPAADDEEVITTGKDIKEEAGKVSEAVFTNIVNPLAAIPPCPKLTNPDPAAA